MLPFDAYPRNGRVPLGRPPIGNGSSRSGYGLALRRLTGQSACAYCGVDLFADYHRWLLLQVDHVVPAAEARRLGIPPDFYEDAMNLVLACSGCNGFDNRYVHVAGPQDLWTVEEFAAVRDAAFNRRAERIAVRRARELEVFSRAPWMDEPPSTSSPINGPAPT